MQKYKELKLEEGNVRPCGYQIWTMTFQKSPNIAKMYKTTSSLDKLHREVKSTVF